MNILIVDDHPITVDGYENVLKHKDFSHLKFKFSKAYSCKEAFDTITQKIKTQKSFDLALIDQGLPSYNEHGLLSGSDLAIFIKKNMPECKIIMITAHTEVVIVYDIVKKIAPDGLVIKNDISPENLSVIVNEVLQGHLYQSPMVKSCINEIWKKDLLVDDINRQILLYLSKGFKIKELEAMIYLTTSAIQKRILLMKVAFDVIDDKGLVKEAIQQGFI
jgi:DNA-binding NarL/FixJ family response regulator